MTGTAGIRRRWAGLALAAIALACAPTGRAAPVRLPDGRQLNIVCEGRGSPTILFESGFGATEQAWVKVKPLLSQTYRVCSYDRAGYGLSSVGPMPRDGAAIARDLDAGLKAASLEGPFILVGHSAGGLYVRLLADRRPRDVVGMVLVDTSVDHQDKAMSMFGRNAASLAPIMATVQRCLDLSEHPGQPTDSERKRCYGVDGKPIPPGLWRTQLSELDTLWGATSDQVTAGRASYGDMPVIILTADGTYSAVPEPARDVVIARWREVHRQIADRSSRGQERLVEHSSHLIMIDQPQSVAQAVRDVVAQAAAKPAHGRPRGRK